MAGDLEVAPVCQGAFLSFLDFFLAFLKFFGVSHVKKWSDKPKICFCEDQKRLMDSRKPQMKQYRKNTHISNFVRGCSKFE